MDAILAKRMPHAKYLLFHVNHASNGERDGRVALAVGSLRQEGGRRVDSRCRASAQSLSWERVGSLIRDGVIRRVAIFQPCCLTCG